MKYNEASLVSGIFKQYGIRCRVSEMVATPSYIHMSLLAHPQERESNIAKVLPDIERMLHDYRMKHDKLPVDDDGVPQNTVVRYTPQPMALEINRADPKSLLWESRQWPKRPLTTLVGRYFEAQRGYPVVIDLNKPEHAHTLVAGTTGSGKSVLLDGLVMSFIESTSPNDIEIALVDFDGRHFDRFSSAPHVRSICKDPDSVGHQIDYAMSKMGKEDRSKLFVLMVDELTLLALELQDSMETLREFAQRGRKHGVHMILATQKPLAAEIGSIVKGNINVRICGSVPSPNDSNTVLDMKQLHAEKLPGRGSFIFRCGNNVKRIQAYMLPDTNRYPARYPARYEPIRTDIQPDMNRYEPISSPIYPDISDDIGQNSKKVDFPLGYFRNLSDDEISFWKNTVLSSSDFVYRGKLSWTKISLAVYGSRDPSRVKYLRSVLDG